MCPPQVVLNQILLHWVVYFLGVCVSNTRTGEENGQQGQTRQPLRSHQVCRDTLEHSEPDGICPPGVWSRPDDIQTQRQEKEGERIDVCTSCFRNTVCIWMLIWIVTTGCTDHTVTHIYLHPIWKQRSRHTPLSKYTISWHIHTPYM